MRNELLAVAAGAFLLTGCTTHHFGDAHIQNNRDIGGIRPDQFYLKAVPLDRPGTHTRQVRDLPFAIYPTHVVVGISPTEAEMKENLPWAGAKLRVEFHAPDGQTFFSKEIALRDAQRGISPGTAHQVEIQFRPAPAKAWKAPEDMPHYTSYDVVVTVLEPSRNKNHYARLYSNIYVR